MNLRTFCTGLMEYILLNLVLCTSSLRYSFAAIRFISLEGGEGEV